MKLLIAVDGSLSALAAVRYALALAAQCKQAPELLLLNVQWNVAVGNVKLFIDQETIADYYREQGLQALAEARALLDAAGLTYQYHVSVGQPAQAIVQYAQEQGVDQIVVGAQGESGVARLLLGSVASKVAQLASVPVTIVH